MAIDLDNYLWTWGANIVGQMGIGASSGAALPTRLDKFASELRSISGGYNTSIAVDTNNNLWAWGFDGVFYKTLFSEK